MNIVMIVPTGIGCEIGGHAGDASPAAKLLASVSDKLIIHPNVVNASDINEMTENMLYVEGSILDRFLEGSINLKEVHKNKILLLVNPPLTTEVVNSVNAARVTVGADISVLELNTPLEMIAEMKDGKASGTVKGWKELVGQVQKGAYYLSHDAIAITSAITAKKEIAEIYLRNIGGVNPWGGVEARVSKLIAEQLNMPVAHSPIDDRESEVYKMMARIAANDPVDPRMSAELVSVSYLHCILKGLHKAPLILRDRIGGLTVKDIDFLVSPFGCWGPPHIACYRAGIPIIVVKENKTCLNEYMNPSCIFVENYLEAVGYIQTYKAGVSPESVRRPIKGAKIQVGNI